MAASERDDFRTAGRTFLVYAFALSILEICAYLLGGRWAFGAGCAWLFAAGLSVLALALNLKDALLADLKDRNLAGICALAACLALLCMGLFSEQANHESAQQAAAGLRNLGREDLGYTSRAFLNYPSRQYLLVALPSVIGGSGFLQLHLGYALPFMAGVLYFYAGTRRAVCERNPLLAGLALLLILSSPYLYSFYLHFEQVTLPAAFTLFALGTLFSAIYAPSFLNLAALTWIGALLGASYTPSLGSWTLLCVVLLYIAAGEARKGSSARAAIWIASFGCIMIAGLLSFMTRGDLPIGSAALRPDVAADPGRSLELVLEGLGIVLSPGSRSFFGAALLIVLALYLASAIRRRAWPHIAIVLWMLLEIVFAVSLTGWDSPPPGTALHRALPIVPVLVAAAAVSLKDLAVPSATWRALLTLCLAVLSLIQIRSNTVNAGPLLAGYGDPIINGVLSDVLRESAKLPEGGPVGFYMFANAPSNFHNYTDYFLPGRKLLYGVTSSNNPPAEGTCPKDFPPSSGVLAYIGSGEAGLESCPAKPPRCRLTPLQIGGYRITRADCSPAAERDE